MDSAATATEERSRLSATLSAVARGDTAAMRDLYARTSRKLYGICLRVLADEAEAEEALQETYVTVWKKAQAFDSSRASPITWLAVVARNKAIDRLRGRRHAPSEGLDAAGSVADDAPNALEVAERAEENGRMSSCLEELDAKQKNAIRSAFFEGATYPMLAEREGVPLGTMKSWVRRGLLQLRGCLER